MENQNQDDKRNDLRDEDVVSNVVTNVMNGSSNDINAIGSGSGSGSGSHTTTISQNDLIQNINENDDNNNNNDTTAMHVQPNLTPPAAATTTNTTSTTNTNRDMNNNNKNNNKNDSKPEDNNMSGSTSANETIQPTNAFYSLNQNVNDNTSLSYTSSGSNHSNTGISLDPSITSAGSGIGNNNNNNNNNSNGLMPQQQQHQQQNIPLPLQQPQQPLDTLPSSPEKVQQVTQHQSPKNNNMPIQQQSNDNLHLTQQMTPSTNTTPSQYTNNQYIHTSPQHSNSLPLQPQLQMANQQLQQEQQQQSQQQQEATIDSILNSPKTKDEIVEKSPGGRYIRFSEKLGSGAYKDVYRAYDTIEGIEVAWNVINLTGVPKSERQYIVNEVRLLEQLNHSNIILFHGSWVNRELEQVIFVTEILSSGTLKSFITKVQVIRWRIAKRWAKKILKGIEYLHSHNPPIVHRDLKCDNIFINGTSGDLRIGDLGLSTFISNSTNKKVSFMCIT